MRKDTVKRSDWLYKQTCPAFLSGGRQQSVLHVLGMRLCFHHVEETSTACMSRQLCFCHCTMLQR